MEIEPAVSLRTRALEETIESTLVVERLLTRLSLFFGGLALLLAGVGLYGVIAYDAARRQRDIGIRLALGSTRRGVVLMVVGQIGWLLGAGLLMGVAVSVPLARWVEGLLYGVTVRDVGTYALAAVALAVVGLAAAWVPGVAGRTPEPDQCAAVHVSRAWIIRLPHRAAASVSRKPAS